MLDQIDSIRAALQDKRSDLIRLIHLQSSRLTIGDGENELLDRMQGMSSREEAVTFLDTLTRTLSNVNAALLAIEEGAYGECVECEGSISPRRLQVIPWASRCIDCQELHDQREGADKPVNWQYAA